MDSPDLVAHQARIEDAETPRRFVAAFPAARVALRAATSREVSALVPRGEAALGLHDGAEADPAPEATPAGREVFVAVARRDWAARLRADGGTEPLLGLPWVGFPPGHNGGSFGEALEQLLLCWR